MPSSQSHHTIHLATMLKLVICLALSVTALAAEGPSQPCDTIWSTIVRGCLELRTSIVTSALQPTNACCNNIKFQACVRAAQGYAAVAKLTKVCPSEVYDDKISSLQSPIDLIATLCTNHSPQSCVTDSISSYWKQFDSKALGETLEQNFNLAVNQLSSIAKNVGQTLNEQRIPERFAIGAESIRNTFNEKAKDVSKAISPNKDVNRYSLVDGDNKGPVSGVDELVDSIFPSVEIIEKDPPSKPEEPATRPTASAFMDWFKSNYDRASTFMKGVGKGAAAGGKLDNASELSDNPYNTNPL